MNTAIEIVIYGARALAEIMVAQTIAYLGIKGTINITSPKGWVISSHPFRETKPNEELIEKINYKHIEDLAPYLSILEQKTSSENCKIAYRNLSSVILKKKRAVLLIGNVGSYNVKKNRIEYASKNVIGHEFLHLASATYDEKNKMFYYGFSQQKKKGWGIGDGLNEGYTELLASRWYNKKRKPGAYKKLVRLSSLFEYFFVDAKSMEWFYFHHDLPGFIKYMEHFLPRKEIIDILKMMDDLYYKTAFPLAFLPDFKEFKIKMKLYGALKKYCKDPYRIAAFEKQISSDPLIYLSLNKNKLKLQKDNPYVRMEQGESKKL